MSVMDFKSTDEKTLIYSGIVTIVCAALIPSNSDSTVIAISAIALFILGFAVVLVRSRMFGFLSLLMSGEVTTLLVLEGNLTVIQIMLLVTLLGASATSLLYAFRLYRLQVVGQ